MQGALEQELKALPNTARSTLRIVDLAAIAVAGAGFLLFVAVSSILAPESIGDVYYPFVAAVAFAWIPLAAHLAQSHVTPPWFHLGEEGIGWSARRDVHRVTLRWSEIDQILRRHGTRRSIRRRVWLEFRVQGKRGTTKRRYLAVSEEIADTLLMAWERVRLEKGAR